MRPISVWCAPWLVLSACDGLGREGTLRYAPPSVDTGAPEETDTDTDSDTDTDTDTDSDTDTDTDTGRPLSTDTGDGANPQGVDVSHWDGDIDWDAVYADGFSFAYIKATQDTNFEDPEFWTNYDGARDAGLFRGAYHFAEPNTSDGATQADYFIEHGGDWVADGYTLPGSLDIEWNPYEGDDCYDMSVGEMTSWIHDFVDQYEARTGRAPTIYCGQLWWSYCVDDSDFSLSPLWVADWSDTPPDLPSGWTDYAFWQYSSDGTVDGIPVASDVNVFHGSEARLGALANDLL
jgi:GH25 family lysozyme M1 (1,4-beta-N-acetylmuramidase)